MNCESTSKELLLEIFEAMPFMAWHKNIDGKFVYVNQRFADGCGRSKADILGKTDYDIWPEKLAESYRLADIAVMEEGQSKFIEEVINDKTGSVWFETFKAPIYDENGIIIGVMGTSKDITIRKKYQNELHFQKRFIKSMMDAVPDLIFFKDLRGIYLGCNKAFAEDFIGTIEEEIVGKTDFDLVKDASLAQFFIERDQMVIKNGKTMINEEVVEFAKGETVYLETLKTPLYDENGHIRGLIGVARDISKRKEIEHMLKDSELRLNLATESTQIGMWDWQVQTGATIFNDQWAGILGYTLEELSPVSIDTWIKFTHPEDLEKSNQLLQAHFEGKADLYECAVRMRHRNNQWIWVLDRGKVIEWDADKKPVRMLGTHIDIDKQKRTETNLRKQEQILSAVAMSIKELITNQEYQVAIEKCFHLIGEATRVDRVYLFVNEYDEAGNGFTSQSIEWNSGVAQPQINNPELQRIPFGEVGDFIETLKGGEAFLGIVAQMPEDRSREILESQGIRSLVVLPIFVRGDFWGFIGFDECKYDRVWEESEFSTLRAFSHSVEKSVERSLIQKELYRAKKNAEAANLLKSQFVANISHEIRTPIHAILGYAALIKEHATDHQCMGYLGAIQKAGDTLMGLLNDILDLSKIEAGKLELQSSYSDLHTILMDVEQVFSLRTQEKQIDMIFEMDDRMPQLLLIDEVRVRQILFNLVGNAVKFTTKGYIQTQVLIDHVDMALSKIDITLLVKDTGIGIPEDQQKVIFEPFKQKEGQSNKHYGGTGLGLSITERLVDMMGGHIELQSKFGEGSVFKVHLKGISFKNGSMSMKTKLSTAESLDEHAALKKAVDAAKAERQSMKIEMVSEMEALQSGIWIDCIQNNRISDFRQFAEALHMIGKSYTHLETIGFSNDLLSAIETFDLKRVKELLNYFPAWLESFGVILHKREGDES